VVVVDNYLYYQNILTLNMANKNSVQELLNAKKECLALWERISKMPSQYLNESANDLKLRILEELGIGERTFGCPLCHRFNGTPNCPLGDCPKDREMQGLRMGFSDIWYRDRTRYTPITDEERVKSIKPCFKTAYNDWQKEIIKNGYHNQDYAKRFYNHLLCKLKE